MEIKKYIVFLVSILVYFNLSFAQSFIINPINLDSNKFSVNEEKVSFSGKNITAILEIENKSKETYRTKISIKCIPQYYGGGSYSSSLIPFDFKLLENDKEIIFSIKYNDKYISKLESLATENHSISFIEFELDFLPKEIKYLTISYENEIDNFTRIFDTDYRLVEKHLFYQNSKKKIVQYISPKKTFSEKDIDYCLLDFIIKNNDEYIINNNYRRIYQDNNFIWMFDVPDDIFEVVCRQDYFNPNADMSIFHIFYSDYFTDLEEDLFSYNKKNISKELLTKSELFLLSKTQLSILRNTFYAKKGYDFKNKDLKMYFVRNCEAQDLIYQINPNFSESDFNEIERKNIELIKEMENLKNPILLSEFLEEK